MKVLILVYFLTFGGALACLVSPYYGVIAYVALATLRPEYLWPWTVPPAPYSKIVAIALILGWALHGGGDWRLGRATGVLAALVGFLAWAAVSASWAAHPEVAWQSVDVYFKIIIPCVIGVALIRSPGQLIVTAWVLLLCLGYIALEENKLYLSGVPIERENIVTHQMTIAVALGYYLGSQACHKLARAAAFLCSLLALHVIFFHASRGAMLGVSAVGAVTFLILRKNARQVMLFSVILAAALMLAGESVKGRFATIFAAKEERDDSAQSRLDLWADMFNEFRHHPVFGIGPENWPKVAHRYGWPEGKEGHSLWVQTAAETGLPGIGLLLTFYLLPMLRLRPFCRSTELEPQLQTMVQLVVATIPGIIVELQFGSFRALEPPYHIAAILGGGTLKLLSRLQSFDGRPDRPG